MTQERVIAKKKLIEVALPLDAINKASAREKSIRHGHPSTLHLWWARRPLAAARAVIFAQMVDDPSANPDLFPTERSQERERQRLFGIIEELVQWENTTNETVLQRAREEIWQSWRRACAENADHPRARELFDRHVLPAFHDPFAGGGSLPLEAQRLGLEANASDLNPVAVLINKAMIEIPPKFAGKPPVNPRAHSEQRLMGQTWLGAQGMAEDVRYYGETLSAEAESRIGHLYPRVRVTEGMAKERPDLEPYLGRDLTVIAWIWVRTVKSPNPAFADIDIPLASTFMLSSKPGSEAYVEPVLDDESYHFELRLGHPSDLAAVKAGTKLSRGANFRCVMSGAPISGEHIKREGKSGRMGARLMAIVAEGERGRIYLAPTQDQESVASQAAPEWEPESQLPDDPRNFWTVDYGLTTFGDLFTPRQLVALTTFSDMAAALRERVRADAIAAGLSDDESPLREGGSGALAYADAVSVYLALTLSKSADRHNSLCSWDMGPSTTRSSTGSPARSASIRNAFSRQSLPMTWDFAEGNPFSESAGNIVDSANWIAKVLERLRPAAAGQANQADAAIARSGAAAIVSTDPPYYDNIGYADLSDFFYVWLRRSLRPVLPSLFATLAVPKVEELVATPYRHGGKEHAEAFFLTGMTQAMQRLAEESHPAYPVTVYYAFKQSETGDATGTSSTGWETFLAAVIKAGFSLTGTWPMRTELGSRMIGSGTNALASSIVLVCRPRLVGALSATRREFQDALRAELPSALGHLQRSNIAPVDLAQAAIGPGMAIFTRYREVRNADGTQMSVRDALTLINQSLDEVLTEQEGDFDADSRWAVTWSEQFGYTEGDYGVAEQLSKAKNTSVDALRDAGILASSRGKVRLFKPAELRTDWDPTTNPRLTAWEMTHHLIRALESGGEVAAATLAAKLGSKAEVARELAYRLYTVSERKKRAADALAYNGLVQSWPEIVRLAREEGASEGGVSQGALALEQP